MPRVRSMLGRVRQEFRRRITNRGLILMYHRIAEEPLDPWRLCVSPTNFTQQLEVLRSMGLRLVHVSRLAEELANGDLPRRTVAITFDDGYSDNIECAHPILQQYDASATFFVTAGYVGRNEEFWWDVLDRIFLQPGALPDVLDLVVSGEAHHWELGDAAEVSAEEASCWTQWRPFREPLTVRHRMHDELWRMLVRAQPEERSRVIGVLLDWARLEHKARPSRRPLTGEQLQQISNAGLVEVGAHSLTHPALPSLSPEAQAHELSASKHRLEELIRKPILGFSYPQGRSTPELEEQTRSAGYAFACGSVANAVTRRSSLYSLPRVSAPDWGEDRFKSFIERHLAA